MERRGSGLKDIIKETANLPGYTDDIKPEFKFTHSNFWVIFKNANYTPQDSDPINDPKADPNDPKVDQKLSERKTAILAYLKDHPNATRKELSNNLGCSDSTIKRELESLTKDDHLERIGSSRSGEWKVL